MILYHGSNMEIGEILLSKGRHVKDFGRGFYLSADYMQAVRMSENVVRREGVGTPVVTKFEFIDDSLDNYNIRRFDGYTKEWAEFILENRKNRTNEQTAYNPAFLRYGKGDQIIEKDMTSADRQFLIETLCDDIVPMIMEEYQLTDKMALDKLYKSSTFLKIENPDTGLYYQSPVYIFDLLKEEFNA